MKPFDTPIMVTKPFLPPLDVFSKGLEEIWDTHWLTNEGPVHKRFESKLSRYMDTDNVCLFNNGTLALQVALEGMHVAGEVITTPFTFVATTHALYWNNIRPVFCDIEPEYFTLDPDKIEGLITPFTSAILAVHVFGNPCKLAKLSAIARKHDLKLIYDAAHAFGVKVDGHPIGGFGDASMFSFHATKLFHTFEGGMLAFRDGSLKKLFNYLKNFGFENETEVVMPGTNAKMNEVQALMGDQLLEYMPELVERSRKIDGLYRSRLKNAPGIRFCPPCEAVVEANYAYMPVRIVEDEFGMSRDCLFEKLKEYNIFTRRYFYPLLCDLPCYRSLPTTDPLIVARSVAATVLCLPTYCDLALDDVERICDTILHVRGAGR